MDVRTQPRYVPSGTCAHSHPLLTAPPTVLRAPMSPSALAGHVPAPGARVPDSSPGSAVPTYSRCHGERADPDMAPSARVHSGNGKGTVYGFAS